MTWRKVGRVYCLGASKRRSTTHMQGPVAVDLHDRIRIYFAARQRDGKSYPAYIDVSSDDPLNVLAVNEEPIMSLGPVGTFDDEGIMPACIVPVNDELWMYYSGWNRRMTVPYHNTTGIARSWDLGQSFARMFDGPILDRTPEEPYMAVTPWVMRTSDLWRMWYVSGLGWLEKNGTHEPVYGVKYAYSVDGVEWIRGGDLVIPHRHREEAIARPTVLERNGRYHMWYCYRNSNDFRDGEGSYRIGYSFSDDAVTWTRADHLSGFERSSDEWESSMQCYPYALESGGNIFLFYNGNSFGQTGIGCAIWEGPLPR